MKKKNLFSRMLLLLALIVGSTSNAWAAEGDPHEFTQNLQQLLNNNNSINSINISDPGYYVKEIKITCRYNKDIDPAVTINATIGGNAFGSSVTVGNNFDGTKSITGSSVKGNIIISFKNETGNGTGHGTFYVTKVTLVEGPSDNTPSITAENVNIYDDATEGSISYTVNHPVDGGVLTAARTVEADTWLTVGNVSATAVAFTTTVNTGAERSTNVRLTYTYDSNQTVTKDVTVTQAAPTTKYTVTIETPTGGTLVVKQGETTVNSGDKFPEGTVLNVTATANDRYKFHNWQAVDATTHTFTASNTGTWTMTAHDVTISATFDAREYHNATFSINGVAGNPVEYEKGTSIVFPSNPADVEGKKFVGWTTSTITGVTDEAPTFVTSAQMGDDDITFYAVFADAEGDGEESITYEKLSTNSFDANATYVVGAQNGNNLALFYSYDNKVDENASWGKMSTDYENNPPLTFTLSGTASALYAKDNKGNYLQGKVNDFRMVSEANKSTITLANDGTLHDIQSSNNTERWLRYNTSYGLRWYATSSSTGVLAYFYKMVVDPGYTYSNYCTSVAPDERQAVNMTGFTATETTLVVGATTNTTVTNDQSGWTAAYTYESDNTDVATVDASGVVTAVAKGTANITATLNVDKDDPDYKAGETKSKSIEITVVNPSHNVTFSVNGTVSDPVAVEEGEAIEFPPVEDVNGYAFVGWLTAAIDGIAESASPVSSATMGDSDITYYAAFGQSEKKNVKATFDAADISNLDATATRTWTDKATGIEMYISDGQRYTGSSTNPAAWNVTKSTSSTDNYMSIGKADCALKKIEVTVTGSNYAFADYYAYTYVTDETGTNLTDDVTNEGNVYSWVLNDSYEQVILWSGNSYQVRATKIVVDAITTIATGVCTTVPTGATVTITSAKYATYSSAYPLDFTNTGVTAYIVTAKKDAETVTMTPIEKVPSNTGLVLYAENANSYDIPVLTGDADEFETNYLHAHLTAGEPEVTGDYYILALGSDNQPGFFKSSGGTLAANRAYLVLPESNGAPSFSFDFGGGTTGIQSLNPILSQGEGVYYDLSGRRVAQPTKGIFILNGKKVVVK